METSYIIAVFPSRAVLTQALDHLSQLKTIAIEHAAIVAKAASGEIVILDDEIGASEGGIAGGALGAAMAAFGVAQLGALSIPGIGAVIALGAGALIGALVGQLTGRFAANLLDAGFHDDDIERLAIQLKNGYAALVLQVDRPRTALPIVRDELKRFRAELVEQLSAPA